MDLIFLKKPNNKLENVDCDIVTYIEILEKKLKSLQIWENFNNQCEQKCLDLQEELFILKSQKNQNQSQLTERQKMLINELEEKNVILNEENKILKTQITQLQIENEKLKNNSLSINKMSTNDSGATVQHSLLSKNISDINSNANSILIKGFTELQLQANPKKNIINLGRYMNIKLSEKDIVSLSIKERDYYNRNNIKPNKMLLIVQFQNAETKVEFLKNKEKLKQKSNVSEVEIADYVSDEVFNLYQYAKILKSHGFNLIYWRNNCVYVKKTNSKFSEPILIESIKDVDNLKSVKK